MYPPGSNTRFSTPSCPRYHPPHAWSAWSAWNTPALINNQLHSSFGSSASSGFGNSGFVTNTGFGNNNSGSAYENLQQESQNDMEKMEEKWGPKFGSQLAWAGKPHNPWGTGDGKPPMTRGFDD